MENKDFYLEYMKIFLEENSKVNLISKNDEKFLWEKHVFDSLAISKFFDKYQLFYPRTETDGKNLEDSRNKNIYTPRLLDIGTGGGFPSVPIAIAYPEIDVYAVDSIGKKVKAVEEIGKKLKLKNLIPICSRVEKIDMEFYIITSRAVSSLKNICKYALPKIAPYGYFVAYKSRKVYEEIKEAKSVLKKYDMEVADIIEYSLPLEENVSRNLVIITQSYNINK